MLEPYVDWLAERLHESNSLWESNSEASINFFAQVVSFFSTQTSLDNPDGEPEVFDFLDKHKESIGDALNTPKENLQTHQLQSQVHATVECIALWAMMETLVEKFEDESILILYQKEYGQPIEEIRNGHFQVGKFIRLAGLIPVIREWVAGVDPKEEIPAKSINARVLKDIAKMEFEWTFDVSKHLQCQDGRTLNVFCMPCKLQQGEGIDEKSPKNALA